MARHDSETRPDGIPATDLITEAGTGKLVPTDHHAATKLKALPVPMRKKLATERSRSIRVPPR